MSILNKRIKDMRTQKGFTLAYVADELGVKEATMQRYESGEIKNIKHEYIVKLAEIFNCNPAYLMGWENKESNTVSSPTSIDSQYDLSFHEWNMVKKYRELDERGRDMIDYMLQKEWERQGNSIPSDVLVELTDLGKQHKDERLGNIAKFQPKSSD